MPDGLVAVVGPVGVPFEDVVFIVLTGPEGEEGVEVGVEVVGGGNGPPVRFPMGCENPPLGDELFDTLTGPDTEECEEGV